jgi:two-component system, response regulator, stage 0 sporulation protein F
MRVFMPRVLVVEDEYNIRLLITKILEQLRYEVTQAEHGGAALEILQQNPDFDIIISDIEMPVIDGVSLTQELKRRYPHVRVVVISAYWDRINEAIDKGANNYLRKPFSRQQLLDALNEAVVSGVGD